MNIYRHLIHLLLWLLLLRVFSLFLFPLQLKKQHPNEQDSQCIPIKNRPAAAHIRTSCSSIGSTLVALIKGIKILTLMTPLAAVLIVCVGAHCSDALIYKACLTNAAIHNSFCISIPRCHGFTQQNHLILCCTCCFFEVVCLLIQVSWHLIPLQNSPIILFELARLESEASTPISKHKK